MTATTTAKAPKRNASDSAKALKIRATLATVKALFTPSLPTVLAIPVSVGGKADVVYYDAAKHAKADASNFLLLLAAGVGRLVGDRKAGFHESQWLAAAQELCNGLADCEWSPGTGGAMLPAFVVFARASLRKIASDGATPDAKALKAGKAVRAKTLADLLKMSESELRAWMTPGFAKAIENKVAAASKDSELL